MYGSLRNAEDGDDDQHEQHAATVSPVKVRDQSDPTRAPEFYDQTYHYLSGLGLAEA